MKQNFQIKQHLLDKIEIFIGFVSFTKTKNLKMLTINDSIMASWGGVKTPLTVLGTIEPMTRNFKSLMAIEEI